MGSCLGPKATLQLRVIPVCSAWTTETKVASRLGCIWGPCLGLWWYPWPMSILRATRMPGFWVTTYGHAGTCGMCLSWDCDNLSDLHCLQRPLVSTRYEPVSMLISMTPVTIRCSMNPWDCRCYMVSVMLLSKVHPAGRVMLTWVACAVTKGHGGIRPFDATEDHVWVHRSTTIWPDGDVHGPYFHERSQQPLVSGCQNLRDMSLLGAC